MRRFCCLSVSALLASLVACGPPATIPQGEFAESIAAVSCDRIRECMRGSFDSIYFGMEDCRVENERSLQALVKQLDEADCDYDAVAAADLWVLLDEMSCEKFYENEFLDEQNEVWGDCFN